MSKAARTVGTVAGVIAISATGIGALAAAGVFGAAATAGVGVAGLGSSAAIATAPSRIHSEAAVALGAAIP